MDMTTLQERIQAAWDTNDPLALHREVERLAAEGHSQQSLEDALEALLLAVRTAGASDATEEIINGVWDRLTGWCHSQQHIEAQSSREKGDGADSPVLGNGPRKDSSALISKVSSQPEGCSTCHRILALVRPPSVVPPLQRQDAATPPSGVPCREAATAREIPGAQPTNQGRGRSF
jgi:hypothetical protein